MSHGQSKCNAKRACIPTLYVHIIPSKRHAYMSHEQRWSTYVTRTHVTMHSSYLNMSHRLSLDFPPTTYSCHSAFTHFTMLYIYGIQRLNICTSSPPQDACQLHNRASANFFPIKKKSFCSFSVFILSSPGSICLSCCCCCCCLLNVAATRECTSGTDLLTEIKLQIRRSISPSHSILTPGQPVLVLTLCHQEPGRVVTGVPIFMSLSFFFFFGIILLFY